MNAFPEVILPPEARRDIPAVVPIRIWADHVPIDQKGNYRAVEFVELARKGTNGAVTVDKIARVMKDPIIWPVVQPYYDAWKKGQEEPTTGTPLAAWPGITRGQADHLRLLNLRSVEDLASTTDADLERIGMGARQLRDNARAFVQAKAGQAMLAEALTEKDKQIADLKRMLQEQATSIQGLQEHFQRRERPKDVARKVVET